jgi:predicted ATPase
LLLAKHPLLQVKPDWQARGLCRELALEFLSAPEIERYLSLEFPEHRFPPELTSLIQAKTEGSPLFMVDLVRDLRNRKVIAQEQGNWGLVRAVPEIEHELPESMRGMIERKIGQLSEEDRPLLEVASVQGYEFDSAVVAQVLNLGAGQVEERLEKLERVFAFVRLVSEKELPDRSLTLRYRFVHVLYQNTFHSSLRASRKVELSRTVAQTIEKYYGEERKSMANELAMLWESAREYAAAADYFRIAAQHAVQVFASQESVTLARRGIAMLQHLPDSSERRAQELFLQVVLGNSLMATRGFAAPELEETYSRARELCRQVGDTPHLLPVIFGEYAFHFVRANLRRALEVAREFLVRAEQQQGPALLAGHRIVGMPLLCMGELVAARKHFEQAASRYEAEAHRHMAFLYGHDVGMASNINLGVGLWLLGYPDAARKQSRDSLGLAREVPHAASQAYSMTHSAMVRGFCGEWQEAFELAENAITLTTRQGLALWLAWALTLRGRALAELGKVKEGIDQIRQGLESAQVIKAELWIPYHLCLLAEVYYRDEMWPTARASLDEAQRFIEKNEERYWEAEVYRLRGELLLMDGAPEANECFHRALEIARRQQAKSLELRAAMSLARSLQRQGKASEAHEVLAESYRWFTEGFDTADLKQAKALLAELNATT